MSAILMLSSDWAVSARALAHNESPTMQDKTVRCSMAMLLAEILDPMRRNGHPDALRDETAELLARLRPPKGCPCPPPKPTTRESYNISVHPLGAARSTVESRQNLSEVRYQYCPTDRFRIRSGIPFARRASDTIVCLGGGTRWTIWPGCSLSTDCAELSGRFSGLSRRADRPGVLRPVARASHPPPARFNGLQNEPAHRTGIEGKPVETG